MLHDLREGGPTDGATLELDLTGENHIGVFIPPGVAHGFAALTDMVITYLVDGYYNPADELGVAWNDPAIGADWGVADPILSARDQTNPLRADLPAGRRPYWPMRTLSMKLFVTGAAGFIGSNYVRWVLANTDDEVTSTTRSPTPATSRASATCSTTDAAASCTPTSATRTTC